MPSVYKRVPIPLNIEYLTSCALERDRSFDAQPGQKQTVDLVSIQSLGQAEQRIPLEGFPCFALMNQPIKNHIRLQNDSYWICVFCACAVVQNDFFSRSQKGKVCQCEVSFFAVEPKVACLCYYKTKHSNLLISRCNMYVNSECVCHLI